MWRAVEQLVTPEGSQAAVEAAGLSADVRG
jgi:hypothetical protein